MNILTSVNFSFLISNELARRVTAVSWDHRPGTVHTSFVILHVATDDNALCVWHGYAVISALGYMASHYQVVYRFVTRALRTCPGGIYGYWRERIGLHVPKMKWSMGKRVLVRGRGAIAWGNLFLSRTGSVAEPDEGNSLLHGTVAQKPVRRVSAKFWYRTWNVIGLRP